VYPRYERLSFYKGIISLKEFLMSGELEAGMDFPQLPDVMGSTFASNSMSRVRKVAK
jgi:hypothetical protein